MTFILNLTDTHCHLDFEKFDPDREAVLERAERAGVVCIIIPGLDLPTSRAAVKLAGGHPLLYTAVGIHPTEAGTWTEDTDSRLRDLIKPSGLPGTPAASKIVAIGEIGLDYYWDSAPHDIQKDILRRQLALAA